MKKLIFLIDPLEKLNIKKDGSLLWALTAQKRGVDCYLLFEKDLYVTDQGLPSLSLWKFEGEKEASSFYVKQFKVTEKVLCTPSEDDELLMRLDPPFDSRYLKVLWLLSVLEHQGIKVSNSPKGILNFNEKTLPLIQKNAGSETFIGGSRDGIENFLKRFPKEKSFIIKPLDLYQGIGVQKIERDDSRFWEKISQSLLEFKGTLVLQPYIKKVEQGEQRAIYYKTIEIGSIVKIPPRGSFLANIAQGATYEAVSLNEQVKSSCKEMAEKLATFGVDLVAFDILGDHISEANITCPGLLVEVSTAMGRNLCDHLCS